MAYIHDMENSTNEDNSDEDKREFARADVEEVEDNLLKISRCGKRTVSTEQLNRISGPVRV